MKDELEAIIKKIYWESKEDFIPKLAGEIEKYIEKNFKRKEENHG